MSTPEEVQEPKSKVPPMPPKQADSAATAELHRRFCSDVPNDGTYTLHLNETETIRFFAEADRLIAAHVAAATAKERQARELAESLLRKEMENIQAYSDYLKSGLMDIAQGRWAVGTTAGSYAKKILYPNKKP